MITVAKEMFKKQGYKQMKKNSRNITYKSKDGILIMFFHLTNEYLIKYVGDPALSDAPIIHLDTHKAVHAQLTELGWL